MLQPLSEADTTRGRTPSDSISSLFPLPLTRVERLFLADHRDEYPMSFFLRLRFQGSIDPRQFTRALDRARALHPMLSSVISGSPSRRTDPLRWNYRDDIQVPIDWNASLSNLKCPAIDLRKACGLRWYVEAKDETTDALLQVHHACSDAMGVLDFLRDFFRVYEGADAENSEPTADQLAQIEQLRSRGTMDLSAWQWLRRAPVDLYRIVNSIKYRPQSLRTPNAPGQSDGRFPAMRSIVLDQAQIARCKAAARSEQGTLNDYLLSHLLQTLHAWNQSHGGEETIRIVVPASVRHHRQAPTSASNMVSMIFINRTPAEFKKQADGGLLRSVIEETRFIKRWSTELTLLRIFNSIVGKRMEASLRTPSDRCLATAVLSNLGQPFLDFSKDDEPLALGQAQLEAVEFVPPIRPQTRLAFGVVTYRDRLTVSVNYDPRHLSENDADTLLDSLLGSMRQAESSDRRGP